MANFTPISAAIGGALIGLAAVLLMLLTGRIAGISGIFGGCLGVGIHDKAWRSAFIAGLILAPLTASWVGYAMPSPQMPASWVIIIAAGLLVGFGSRLGGGCTSGHGISGIFGGLLDLRSEDKAWRIAFMAGLILAPILSGAVGYAMAPPKLPASWTVIAAAGLLVGFGTRLGGGCTSGHGICGIARLSTRSVVATIVFMVTAVATVAITHHVLGG